MHTKLGYQFLGNPPERFRALCGGSKGIKIVGNAAEIMRLQDWRGTEILQARLITAEEAINQAKTRGNLLEIPALADQTARSYATVAAALGMPEVWWEIPPIMPDVSEWYVKWILAAIKAFRAHGLRSVPFGFATGTPQVAPFAGKNGHGPDEWPKLYPVLEEMDRIGPAWTRLGVEEYITGGILLAGDYSNICRLRYVYENHILPHGWLIISRVIETTYDVPSTYEAGVTPDKFFDRGMRAADAVYGAFPWVDCALMYQVSDPVTFTNESKFALTPGDPPTKKNPNPAPGYLDVCRAYMLQNAPAPYVAPERPGGGSPAPEPEPGPDPEPEPAPVPVPVDLINPDFELQTYQDGPDRIVPIGWFAWERLAGKRLGSIHVEIEQHPPHVFSGRQAARVWTAWIKHDGGLGQRVPAQPGALYRLSIPGMAWCPEEAVVGTPSAARMNMRIGIDPRGGVDPLAGSVVWSPEALALHDTYGIFNVEARALADFVTIFTRSEPEYPMSRNDAFWDSAQLTMIIEPAPEPEIWAPVELSGDCNLRSTPEYRSDLSNKIGYLGAGTEGEGGYEVGEYTHFRILGYELGWVYTKNVRKL